MKKYVGFRSNQWQYQGGHEGAFASPVEGSMPFCFPPPPSEGKNGKNWPFSVFFKIFSLRYAFYPLDAPPPKKKHKILVLPLGQIEVSLCKTGIANSFQAFPPCGRMRHSLWLELDCGLNSEAVRL